jgi:hypothetical protein
MNFSIAAEQVLERGLDVLREHARQIDKRTREGKLLVSTITRLERLRAEIRR